MSTDRETKEFTFSTGRKAVIAELNGLEQFQADKTCNTSNELPVLYVRAAASLISLDGEVLPRAFDTVSLNRVLQKLKARESDELVREYVKAFSNFSTEELGNESKVEDLPPSS